MWQWFMVAGQAGQAKGLYRTLGPQITNPLDVVHVDRNWRYEATSFGRVDSFDFP